MVVDEIYTPLPSRSQTIRLLDLQPGECKEGIEVELRETPITSARNRYITVSYTWGNIDTIRQVFITCNGRRLPISENLYTVLRRLRRPDHSVLVWADALCINQSDNSERTHQVGLMGEIYKNSRETIIWLGEGTASDDMGERIWAHCMTPEDQELVRRGGLPRIAWQGNSNDERLLSAYLEAFTSYSVSASFDIAGAFCLIQSLAQGTSTLGIKFLQENVPTKAKHWLVNAGPQLQLPSGIWSGLDRLMSRPWWSRIWVIQETVLAQEATVRFGSLSAPWSMFAAAAANYHMERHSLCLDLAGTLLGQDMLDRFSHSVLQIGSTRSHHQVYLNDVTLITLLWKFRSLEASDKRDKVFALLGLTTNWQGMAPIRPDYQKDVGTTYIQTAVSIIQRSASLSVLAGDLDAGLGRKRLKGIPSWVMDWALPCLRPEVERVNTLNMYNASNGEAGTVRLHQLHSILEVDGDYQDDVAVVGEISRHTQISDTCAVIRKWNFLTRNFEAKYAQYPSGCSYHEAFWRTLIGDVVHTGRIGGFHGDFDHLPYRRATSEDYDAFQAWRMWARCISRDTYGRTASFTQRDLDEGISSIHYALKTATASRCFFITRHGYMGIGPKSTSPGDKLYVLKGSKVPFLVRPDSLRNCVGMGCTTLVGSGCQGSEITSMGTCKELHNCYRLVGDCFAYGLMDGESLKSHNTNVKRLFLV